MAWFIGGNVDVGTCGRAQKISPHFVTAVYKSPASSSQAKSAGQLAQVSRDAPRSFSFVVLMCKS